ncbi:histidine kinase [Blautia schinkii]|nr:histidine kinase [Blautia schinkii]
MLKKLGFQKRLIVVSVVFFMSIILVLVTGFSIYIFKEHEEQQQTYFIQSSENIAEKVGQMISDMDAISSQIVGNASIQREVMDAVYAEDEEGNYFDTHLEARRKVRIECSSINLSKNSVEQIFIYRSPHIFIRYAGMDYEDETVYDVLSSKENQELIQMEEGSHYKVLPPHKSRWEPKEDRLVISMIRPLTATYYTKEQIATIEVLKPYEDLEEACTLDGKNEGVGILIMDRENGEIVYSNEKIAQEDARFYQKQLSLGKELRTIKNQGSEREILYTKDLKNCNWSVLLYQPYGKYMAPIIQIVSFIAVLCFLFTIFTAFITYIIINKMTKPIRVLRESLDDVTFDNIHITTNGETNDEVEQLRVRFNDLLTALQTLSNSLLQSKTAELKAKLMSLQAQINPHFLFNSIMVIGAAGQEAQNDKVEQMCLELSGLFRYASDEAQKSTIEKELGYIENYLHFMKWRYLDELEYQIHVTGETRKIEVPKMILQPLVENCFTHGFKMVRAPYRLTVNCSYGEKSWQVEVLDNGGGFSQEMLGELAKMKGRIDSDFRSGSVSEIASNNRAVINVYARLKLIFKEGTFFEFENLKERGARVVIGGNYMAEGVSD